jgi:hypothetical protein
LAPCRRLEDVVEEEPEEIQLEAEIEEDPEEVQLKPEEEEDLEEVEMEEELVEPPQLYDGTVLEADGDIVIPPAPMAADDASPPPVSPAPNAMGGDPDDSGDDNEDEIEDNNNTDKDPEEEEDDDPCYRGAEYHKHSTEDESGKFCVLLHEVMQHLGYTMKSLYVTKHFSEPGVGAECGPDTKQ